MDQFISALKAISDESRLRILNLLLSRGELCVCDIEAILGATQTKVSRHLAYLRRSGLVSTRRSGLWILYSIPQSPDGPRKDVLSFLPASSTPATSPAEISRDSTHGCAGLLRHHECNQAGRHAGNTGTSTPLSNRHVRRQYQRRCEREIRSDRTPGFLLLRACVRVRH